jgi:hypothetical protein
MRYCTAAILVAAALATTACGNNTSNRPEPETALAPAPGDPAMAAQADTSWMNALQSNNAQTAGAALDADFEWTDSSGGTRTRAETLEALPALAAEFRDESDRDAFHYGTTHVITSERDGGRMMRVWTLRPGGWRLFAAISTATAAGTSPFATAGAPVTADCDNPCRRMPFEPVTATTKEIARIFMMLKMDEWHPNPDNWAPYVLDDVYYVSATARMSKADRLERLQQGKESGVPSVPGDPVVSARIHDFGESAVMIARHNPYRGGKPYYSLRVWAQRDGRWQLANTQQTVIAEAPAVPPAGS